MVMMALLPPGGLLGGYGADPDGVNGSWEEACTCVSTSIRVRVAITAGEYPRHLPQRLFLACPRPASMGCEGSHQSSMIDDCARSDLALQLA